MTNTKRAAWNCKHCHATNVALHCGCAADRAARGIISSTLQPEDIHIELPAPKARKRGF